MPAYLIAAHTVTDQEKFEEYKAKVGPLITQHGGRFLTKAGTHKYPEGGPWMPGRVIIVEFPSMEALQTWYDSPEYQPLIALRKSFTSDMDLLVTVDGA